MRICLLLAVGLLVGCSEPMHLPKPQSAIDQPAATFEMAPKALYEAAKRAVASPPLSLPIEQEEHGSFVTGYKEYPGEWHIARRWQERTRYRVTVIPDFDSPTARARLTVVEETQTRATDGQTWQMAPDVTRPDRANDLLQQIKQQVGAAGAKS